MLKELLKDTGFDLSNCFTVGKTVLPQERLAVDRSEARVFTPISLSVDLCLSLSGLTLLFLLTY
jgi:hypothetical protein